MSTQAALVVIASRQLQGQALADLKARVQAVLDDFSGPATLEDGGNADQTEEVARLREAVVWLVGSDRCRSGEVLLREALGIERRGASIEAPLLDPQILACRRLVKRMPWTRPTIDLLAKENSGWNRLRSMLRTEEG